MDAKKKRPAPHFRPRDVLPCFRRRQSGLSGLVRPLRLFSFTHTPLAALYFLLSPFTPALSPSYVVTFPLPHRQCDHCRACKNHTVKFSSLWTPLSSPHHHHGCACLSQTGPHSHSLPLLS